MSQQSKPLPDFSTNHRYTSLKAGRKLVSEKKREKKGAEQAGRAEIRNPGFSARRRLHCYVLSDPVEVGILRSLCHTMLSMQRFRRAITYRSVCHVDAVCRQGAESTSHS